jgi:DNA-binding Lrp family transcriptional regulator
VKHRTQREDILAAIRAGAVTSEAIAIRLGLTLAGVSHQLGEMRRQGRIKSIGHVECDTAVGRPLKRYAVVEDWRRPKRPPISAEVRAKISETLRKARANPELERRRLIGFKAALARKREAVPKWVLPAYEPFYREIARVLGEHTAAEYARAAKKMDATA